MIYFIILFEKIKWNILIILISYIEKQKLHSIVKQEKKQFFDRIIAIFMIIISLGITIYFTFCLFNNDNLSVIFSIMI